MNYFTNASANLRPFPSSTIGNPRAMLPALTHVEEVEGIPAITNSAGGAVTVYRFVCTPEGYGWVASHLLDKPISVRETYRHYIGMVHMASGYKNVNDLETAQQHNTTDCNRSACIAAQELGLLPRGMIIKHTKAGGVKKKIADAVSIPKGAEQYYRFIWADKPLTAISKSKLVEGALLYYDSDAAILGGDGYAYSCNKAVGGKYTAETNYRIKIGDTSRYVGKKNVLVIAIPIK